MTPASATRIILPVVAALTALGVAGCSGGSSAPAAAPTPTRVQTPTCPAVTASPSATSAAAEKILRSLPFDLPIPPQATPVGAMTTADGVRVVRYTTPTSVRDSVLFILQRYQKAGYVIGRGDAEPTEADAPWVHSTTRGLTRVAAVQQCQTLWLVAVVDAKGTTGSNSPLLSPHPTSSTTSSLPFG